MKHETMSPSRDPGISFEEVPSLFCCQPVLSYPFPAPTAAIKQAPLWSASLMHSLPAGMGAACGWRRAWLCANPRACRHRGECSTSRAPGSFPEPNSRAQALPLSQKPAPAAGLSPSLLLPAELLQKPAQDTAVHPARLCSETHGTASLPPLFPKMV